MIDYLQILIYVIKIAVRLKKLYTLYWLQTTGFVIKFFLKLTFYAYSEILNFYIFNYTRANTVHEMKYIFKI